MPLPYLDSAGFILWIQNDESQLVNTVVIGREHLTGNGMPFEHRYSPTSTRAYGCIGGTSLPGAQREAAWWFANFPDRRDAEFALGNTFVLRNYDTEERYPALVISPVQLTPAEEARKKQMIKLKFRRESGKLVLEVDARPLHETLDAIGCRTQVAAGVTRYESRPHAAAQVVDTATHTLSTEIFLVKSDQPKVYDLSAIYQRPPSLDNLKKLADSANEKCRAILEHYQPVDIQVSIQKKLIG